jgi:hypothetical protein
MEEEIETSEELKQAFLCGVAHGYDIVFTEIVPMVLREFEDSGELTVDQFIRSMHAKLELSSEILLEALKDLKVDLGQ